MKHPDIYRLAKEHTLDDAGLATLLTTSNHTMADELAATARSVTDRYHGRVVKTRGLIEISSYCRNNCLYCGIRAGNTKARRYRLTHDEILECCNEGARLGFKTFVLQGGEDPRHTTGWVEKAVSDIRAAHPSAAITLSLGERPEEDYRRWFDAGADRYLLRHETANPAHYARLHPDTMSWQHRADCLKALKRIGYETGTGMMIGSPFQTTADLVADLRFIEALKPDMIGIGPFVSHHDTPFANEPNGSVGLTLRLISILRLMHPTANIPATTSLGTLASDGRLLGINAGANVVMPNLSPLRFRKDYSLYDNKICTDLEAAESRKMLAEELAGYGYILD
ncbi:MAG: [FeFe] hydrogenase H-cluster radical SAM maturase HydE [Candidatus Aphodosoma sp.]